MAKRYSQDFKHSMVRLVINGEMTPAQVCREHQLAKSCLYTWLQQFAAQGKAVFQDTNSYQPRQTWTELRGPEKEDEAAIDIHLWSMETRIADLERLCGQLALENARLKRDLATTQRSAL